MIVTYSSRVLAPESAQVSPPAGKVAEPRNPTPEELSVEFSSTDIEEPVPVVVAKETPKVEEPAVVETPAPKVVEPLKPLPKAAEPAKVESAKIQPILPPAAQPKARDYTGFTPEEQAVLKAMSNEAFNYTSRALKEKKELEKFRDASFLQHPQAFTLDPAYNKLVEDATYFTREGEYWQEQLVKIKSGEQWTPIVGWNANGSPQLGAAGQPTPQAEEQVRMAMNQCFNAAGQSQQKLKEFASNYQQRVQQDNQAIQQECARRFGWVADPKIMDVVMNVPEVGDRTIRQIKDDFTSLFPEYQRNTIGVDVAGHLFVALQIYGQQIRELQNGKQVAEIKAEEVTRAEPTSKAKPTANGKTIGGVSEFSLDGLPI